MLKVVAVSDATHSYEVKVGVAQTFQMTDGMLTIDQDGNYTFHYTGPDLPVGSPDYETSFKYTISDGKEGYDTATVKLCIEAALGVTGSRQAIGVSTATIRVASAHRKVLRRR